MDIQQLELPLWAQLQSARLAPQVVDLVAVLDQADRAISQLPESQQMAAAAEAMLQIAQLCSLRAEVLITEWEDAYRDPVVSGSFFSDIVRQTMAVDLSDLIEPASPRKRRSQSTCKGESSLAAVVDKSAVLAMVEQMEAQSQAGEIPVSDEQHKELVLAVAHPENISAWVEAISHYLDSKQVETLSFVELAKQVKYPVIQGEKKGSALVKTWIALLLGGFTLSQCGEFYDPGGIRVGR